MGKLSKSLIYERLQKARGLIIHTPVPTPTCILRSQRNTIFSENVTFLIHVPVFTSVRLYGLSEVKICIY